MTQDRTHTYEYGNITIVVHRPGLDDNERRKREAVLQTAIACYGKAIVRNGRGEAHEQNG